MSSIVSTTVLHSGNIASLNKKTQSPLSTPAEISSALSVSIQNLSKSSAGNHLLSSIASDPARCLPREVLQITSKIFLNPSNQSFVKQVDSSVDSVLKALPYAESIDLLIVSIPTASNSASELKHVWEHLESLVDRNVVKSLGVSDFSVSQLEALLSFARIAPLVNHVALANVSDELLAFSKARSIELRARPNSDSDVDLSVITADSWSVSWALRYSVTAKHQHLLLTKGYLFECMQENNAKTTKTIDASPNPIVLSH